MEAHKLRVLESLAQWFSNLGYRPMEHQRAAWEAWLDARSGLIHVPTGNGKTLAAVGAPLAFRMLRLCSSSFRKGTDDPGKIVYVTPLRALARDLQTGLLADLARFPGAPLDGLRVELRTGDTPASRRARQKKSMPDMLITTPESLSLLLSHSDSSLALRMTGTLIIDEWHELLSSKRGTQTELCRSYIQFHNRHTRVWGLSATVGNVEEAAKALVGLDSRAHLIESSPSRPLRIETLRPPGESGLPWSGHLGIKLVDALLSRLDPETSTLIFTNTRSQAERWFSEITLRAPDMLGRVALHHGSMDVEIRRAVERGIASGELKWVVATSSLDLGIDFRPVRTVVQIGSPKSVGRFVQRSGRSNHAPGMSAEVIAVPTYALELLELEAVSSCSEKGLIEPRRPITAPIDVLCQHLMTLACGSGLREEEAWEQVRSTLAFSGLSPKEFSSVFDFVSSGGEALRGYEDYERLAEVDGRFRPIGRRVATLHRLSIGTITARRGIALQYTNGKRIGIAEERFVSQLKKGDVFVFAGRKLELVMVRGMKAYVRTTGARAPVSATWIGAGLPYSPVLARKVRDVLAQLAAQCHPGSRDEADRSLLFDALGEQASRSAFPQSGELLVERFASDLGFHLFLYPFEGRRVHEAIATLLAYRLSGLCEVEITISSDDNGAELLFPGLRGFPGFRDSDSPIRLNGEQELRSLLSPEHAEADLEGGLNIAELARREFRSIAQIAGLVHPGYPNAPVPQAELQTSADVLYDVLKKYDPNNLLLAEARRQVREDLLETGRLTNCLKRLQRLRFRIISLSRPTPFCFPLMAKRESASLSSESAHTRLQRLQKRWRIP